MHMQEEHSHSAPVGVSRHPPRPTAMHALAAGMVFLSLTSCSALPPVHAYDGPPRPLSEVARVTAVSYNEQSILRGLGERLYIDMVDKRPTYDPLAITTATQPTTVFVLPGEHTFTLLWVSGPRQLKATVPLATLAGHEYRILQALEDGQLKLWSEDVTKRRYVADLRATGAQFIDVAEAATRGRAHADAGQSHEHPAPGLTTPSWSALHAPAEPTNWSSNAQR